MSFTKEQLARTTATISELNGARLGTQQYDRVFKDHTIRSDQVGSWIELRLIRGSIPGDTGSCVFYVYACWPVCEEELLDNGSDGRGYLVAARFKRAHVATIHVRENDENTCHLNEPLFRSPRGVESEVIQLAAVLVTELPRRGGDV